VWAMLAWPHLSSTIKNRNIANDLANLIVEAQQELPGWLEQIAQQGSASMYSSSRMNRSAGARKPPSTNFGGRDYRSQYVSRGGTGAISGNAGRGAVGWGGGGSTAWGGAGTGFSPASHNAPYSAPHSAPHSAPIIARGGNSNSSWWGPN